MKERLHDSEKTQITIVIASVAPAGYLRVRMLFRQIKNDGLHSPRLIKPGNKREKT
jgi:hypothetical protein